MKVGNTIIIVGLLAILIYVIYRLMSPAKTSISNTNLSNMMNGSTGVLRSSFASVPATTNANTGYTGPTPETVRSLNGLSQKEKGGGKPNCPAGFHAQLVSGDWTCIGDLNPSGKQNEPNENLSCTDIFAMKTRIEQLKINAGIASANLNASNTKNNQNALINANTELNLAVISHNSLAAKCNSPLITLQQNAFVKSGITTVSNVSNYNGAIVNANGQAVTPTGNGQFIKM